MKEYETYSFSVIPMILTIPNFLAQSVKEQILLRNGTNHTIYSLQVVKNEVKLLVLFIV